MASSTAIGTRAETEVVKALHRAGLFKAKREAKGGAKDRSDVHLPIPRAGALFVIEVKAGKQTKSGIMSQTPSWGQIKGWWDEAVVEAKNVDEANKDPEIHGVVPLLVVRRWGNGKAEDWWVYFNDGGLLCSARFGDWIDSWVREDP